MITHAKLKEMIILEAMNDIPMFDLSKLKRQYNTLVSNCNSDMSKLKRYGIDIESFKSTVNSVIKDNISKIHEAIDSYQVKEASTHIKNILNILKENMITLFNIKWTNIPKVVFISGVSSMVSFVVYSLLYFILSMFIGHAYSIYLIGMFIFPFDMYFTTYFIFESGAESTANITINIYSIVIATLRSLSTLSPIPIIQSGILSVISFISLLLQKTLRVDYKKVSMVIALVLYAVMGTYMASITLDRYPTAVI